MTRRLAVIATALAASCVLTSPAGATTTVNPLYSPNGGVNYLTSGSDRRDVLTLTGFGSGATFDYLFDDPGGVTGPVPPCIQVSPTRLRCPGFLGGRTAGVTVNLKDGRDRLGTNVWVGVLVADLGEGNDKATGGSANDVISGGKGDDVVAGGKGNDKLKGDAGRDRLLGDAGRDTLRGGKGPDTLIGGRGRDTLIGGSGKDKVRQ